MKPLTTEHALLLRGREREVHDIVENCVADRTTVVTGVPGCGLTAILQAGVLPELSARGFIVLYFCKWSGKTFAADLREALAKAVREQADEQFGVEIELLTDTLHRARMRTQRPVTLLLDDFQDYLRWHKRSDLAHLFDAEIASVLAGRDARTVLALHDDALSDLERLRPHVPNLLGYHCKVGLLSRDDAREMILSRADTTGKELEQPSIDGILNDAIFKKEAGYSPFLISLAVDGISSGVAVPVPESLDAIIEKLSSPQKQGLLRLCRHLVTESGKRLMKKETGLRNPTLLPRLIELGLLREVKTEDGVRHEIAREAMAPILWSWYKRRRAAKARLRRSAFVIVMLLLALVAVAMRYFTRT